MGFNQWAAATSLLLLLLLFVGPTTSSLSIIQTTSETASLPISDGISGNRLGVDLYCESWRFTVETNDAGVWTSVPERCVDFVKEYFTGDLYLSESEAVARNSLAHAAAAALSGNGKDAWVFDVDETLLSNLPYYADHGFGSGIFDEPSFDYWVNTAAAPPLYPSLRLYNRLKEIGFTVFLLTGRSESQRNATEQNLLVAGYRDWEKLILRGDSDQGKPAAVYKSEKRREIEEEGYVIHGNSGDQWTDLIGYAVGKRSFKIPNPMYYVA